MASPGFDISFCVVFIAASILITVPRGERASFAGDCVISEGASVITPEKATTTS